MLTHARSGYIFCAGLFSAAAAGLCSDVDLLDEKRREQIRKAESR